MKVPPRLQGIKPGELWGYVVWGLATVIILVPELVAVAGGGQHPWPTISRTIGTLEGQHHWITLIVVAVIVFVAFHLLHVPPTRQNVPVPTPHGSTWVRTPYGRLTRRQPAGTPLTPWILVLGAVFVVATSVPLAALFSERSSNPDKSGNFVLAWGMYSAIGFFFIVVPSVFVYICGHEVPYPSLFSTLRNLRRRFHLLTVALAIGAVILLIHLALYPWPGFRK